MQNSTRAMWRGDAGRHFRQRGIKRGKRGVNVIVSSYEKRAGYRGGKGSLKTKLDQRTFALDERGGGVIE